ncbi:MAG TPA: ABC transporter ATP-binding protein [Rectinemataceae bacterium]|nr:ABC transporter ATP-binding protein [Rectinemataceae bacterium]
MSLLTVNHITKRFEGLVAVDDVSIKVEKGEIISVIGPNGAGKTTFFNMLTGIYPITDGEIIFNGKNIHDLIPQEIVEAGMARTFQNLRLFSDMRVIENVLLGMHINVKYGFFDLLLKTPRYRREENALHENALEILHEIGLDSKIDSYATNLPYGDQKRLEIARAIATKAQLLLLDEPAAGMNPQESESLLEFITTLRNKGYTILLIEHDMNVVMKISDRIYVLDHGKLIAEGRPEEIARNKTVIDAYLGKEEE